MYCAIQQRKVYLVINIKITRVSIHLRVYMSLNELIGKPEKMLEISNVCLASCFMLFMLFKLL